MVEGHGYFSKPERKDLSEVTIDPLDGHPEGDLQEGVNLRRAAWGRRWQRDTDSQACKQPWKACAPRPTRPTATEGHAS
eukprot:5147093-Pyramimonas_sp.AAC.1